jgi:hypothetical protein
METLRISEVFFKSKLLTLNMCLQLWGGFVVKQLTFKHIYKNHDELVKKIKVSMYGVDTSCSG